MASIGLMPLYTGTLVPCTHRIGDRVGSVFRPGALEKTEISYPCQKSNPKFLPRLNPFLVSTIKPAVPNVFLTTLNLLAIGRDIFRALFSIREALSKKSEKWTKGLGIQFRAEGYPMVTSIQALRSSVMQAVHSFPTQFTPTRFVHGYSSCFNLFKPTGYVMHRQFNIQQLYALPTLYLCVLYLSENKQRLVPLTA